MTGGGVFDRAKALQRSLVDRASLRDKRIARANASLQGEVLALLAEHPAELVSMVHRALRMDRAQGYLVQCLDEVLTQRMLSAGQVEQDPVEAELGESFAATFDVVSRPESVAAITGESDRTWQQMSDPIDDIRAAFGVNTPVERDAMRMVTLPDGRVVPLRYPDPGEPAVELADGTLVAVP